MITVAVDAASPVPPFEQLRQQLERHIRNGTLRAGEQLPTVRQLARDLGLAKNTVARGYQALERDGLVVGDRRRGTIVLEQAQQVSGHHDAVASAAHRYLSELEELGVSIHDAIEAVRTAFTQRTPQHPPTHGDTK
jgi:DNA-binding transcriptional regulator YhcF (GntR family)